MKISTYFILQYYYYYYYKPADYYNSKAELEPQATQMIRTQEVIIREAKTYSLIGIAMYPCTKHAKGLSLYYIDQQPGWYKTLQ